MPTDNFSAAQKLSLLLLRVSMGVLFLYSGLSKIFDPSWSAAGYLANAKTLPGLFAFFAQPEVLPITNLLNEWGQFLIGVSLILGIFVRVSSVAGITLMVLYYLPALNGFFPNPHSFIVDEHVIYAAALFVLAASRAGRAFGLEGWCAGLPVCSRFPRLRSLVG